MRDRSKLNWAYAPLAEREAARQEYTMAVIKLANFYESLGFEKKRIEFIRPDDEWHMTAEGWRMILPRVGVEI